MKDLNIKFAEQVNFAKTIEDSNTLFAFVTSNREDVRCALAQNKFSTSEILHTLSLDVSKEVRSLVVTNKNTSKETLKLLSNDKESSIRMLIASHEDISKEILDSLSDDTSSDVRRCIANRKDLSKEVSIKLIEDSDDDVSICALANLKEDVLKLNIQSKLKNLKFVKRLIASEQLKTNIANHYLLLTTFHSISYRLSYLNNKVWGDLSKERLASSETHSPEMLDQLALDHCAQVRVNVAKNDSINEKTLDYLSLDVEDSVRKAVAENKFTSKETLSNLSKDVVWAIRSAVARNPKTPKDALDILVNDTNNIVRLYARKNIDGFF